MNDTGKGVSGAGPVTIAVAAVVLVIGAALGLRMLIGF